MEIRVLKYFLAVVREESITRAAEILHITQPTLSRQMAQLEEEVGVRLLVRGTRRVTLTNEGFLLRRRAEEILELMDKTERELMEQEENLEGRIVVGCGEMAAVQVLADIFAKFQQRYPRVRCDLYTATADQVQERIEHGLVDVGLLLEPVDMEKYDFIRLPVKERWVVLLRADDPLAAKKGISAADMLSRPIIMTQRPKVQRELAAWFGPDVFEKLDIRFTSNMPTNAAMMVWRGLGYAFTLEGSLPFWDAGKVCRRPLSPELSATTVFAWKRQQPLNPVAEKFISYIKCFLSMPDNKI